MTTETKARKMTAANSPFLAECKRLFNARIYGRCLALVNAEGEGAAREYLVRVIGWAPDAR